MLEIALVFAGESHALQSTLPAGRTILSTLQPLCMMGRSEKPVYPELDSGKACQILKFGAIVLKKIDNSKMIRSWELGSVVTT